MTTKSKPKTKTKPKKKAQAQKKKLYCKMCDNEIEMYDELWESNEGIFCSDNCLARYVGNDDYSNDEDDYKYLLEQYGERR